MKKLLICIFALFIIKSSTAQQGLCSVSNTEKPWYVLNGQMVSKVYPNIPGSGISDYVLSIKSTSPGNVIVVKTEEMLTIDRLPIINGLSRWQVRFKTDRARTIYSVVINCGGIALAYELVQPVILCATPLTSLPAGATH
jgi:hypothetical protein